MQKSPSKQKSLPPPSQIHLKTRKSQPISQKIRDDFYCYDSMPRFFSKKKLYDAITQPRSKSPLTLRNPSTFADLFSRTSPDGFSPAQGRKRQASPQQINKGLLTPRFRCKKRVENIPLENIGKIDDKAVAHSDYKGVILQKSGKKVLRMDDKGGAVIFKNFTAYKNLSRVFEKKEGHDPELFVSEYQKNYRAPALEAYTNERSPFQ